MTIASALDKLNDKLAGSDQPASQTIEGMILRLIDNIDQGGGGSIPVASTDTLGGIKVGDNLSITEGGVLSATGGGGGAAVTIVTITYDEATETYISDKTYLEIAAQIEAGSIPILVDEYGSVYHLTSKPIPDDAGFIYSTLSVSEGILGAASYMMDSDNVITFDTYSSES